MLHAPPLHDASHGAAHAASHDADAVWREQLASPHVERRQRAVETIISHYFEEMTDVAAIYLYDRQLAEDIAQETCLRFWAQHRTAAVHTTYRAYLLACTRNAAKSGRRTQCRERDRTVYALDGCGSTENDAVTRLAEDDIAACLECTIAAMPPVRREVVELVIRVGTTLADVAEILGLSQRTVIDHMYLANRDIKRALVRDGLLTPAQSERALRGRWPAWIAQRRRDTRPDAAPNCPESPHA